MTLQGHVGPVHSVCVSPCNALVASGSQDISVRLWDIHQGVQLMVLDRHVDTVSSLAFSPDGSRLVSGSADETLVVRRLHVHVCFM